MAFSIDFLKASPPPIILCCKALEASIIAENIVFIASPCSPQFFATSSKTSCSLCSLRTGISLCTLYSATCREISILFKRSGTNSSSILSISFLSSNKSINYFSSYIIKSSKPSATALSITGTALGTMQGSCLP